MKRLPFNVLQPSPAAAAPRQVPWAVVAATMLFLGFIGRDMEAQRQTLVNLRYSMVATGLPAPGTADADTTAAPAAALAAELTFPWDNALNFLGAEAKGVQWLTLEAGSEGQPSRLQVRATQASDFWQWLAKLQKHPAIASAMATTAQSQANDNRFEVVITWKTAR